MSDFEVPSGTIVPVAYQDEGVQVLVALTTTIVKFLHTNPDQRTKIWVLPTANTSWTIRNDSPTYEADLKAAIADARETYLNQQADLAERDRMRAGQHAAQAAAYERAQSVVKAVSAEEGVARRTGHWSSEPDRLLCLFCGRVRGGGVAGHAPSVYICPDCIHLAAELLDEQESSPGSGA